MFVNNTIMNFILTSSILIFLTTECVTVVGSEIYRVKGSSVQLICSLRATATQAIGWSFSSVFPTLRWTAYTANDYIDPKYPRLNLTGDFNAGEYNLVINQLTKEDEGFYQCFLANTGNAITQQLIIIVFPSNVTIRNSDNKLLGTEGQSLQITCKAVGGDPAPDVQILRSSSVVSSDKQTVTYTIPTLQRSDDGHRVTCRAGYIQINSFPLIDAADLFLSLKALATNFSLEYVSVTENHNLDISCISFGSRPAAVHQWELGGVNISGSTVTFNTLDPTTETYTVTSRLTYTLAKDHNRHQLSCKAINNAAPGGVSAVPITVNVKYPPTVTVSDMTVTEETLQTVLTCTADGNPDTYTFYEWTHESLQGTLIRTLPANTDGRLTLPNVNIGEGYQNTGRYKCTVGNGIPDTMAKTSGYGILTVNAPPVFAQFNRWIQGGELGKAANISVYIYSVPSPSNIVWYRDNMPLPGLGYSSVSSKDTVTAMFHGQKVQVNGYSATLSIANVKDVHLSTYSIRVGNVRGTIENTVTFEAYGPPKTPANFSETGSTETTVNLQWIPVLSTEHEQTFVLEYRIRHSDDWHKKIVFEKLNNLSVGIQSYTLKGLRSGTVYEIKLYAENAFGRSLPSDVEIFATMGIPCESDSSTLTGVAVGLSTITVISLIINGMFTLRMMNGNTAFAKPKSKSNEGKRKRTSMPEVYYNIADDNGDKDDNPRLNIETYEELGTKEKPNEYDDLDKTLADKISDKTEHKYESLGKRDKPNEYEDLDV